METINKTELNILKNLYLIGCIGKSGSLTAKQRLNYLNGLISKGLINDRVHLTKEGLKTIGIF